MTLDQPLEDIPSVERDNVETFLRSLLEIAFASQRRVTVVAIPEHATTQDRSSERLVAWAIWMPPHSPPPQGLTVPTIWGSQGLEVRHSLIAKIAGTLMRLDLCWRVLANSR